jgi:phosphonate metabolism protein PhnM
MRGSIVITNARLIMNHEVIHGSVSVVNGRIDSIDSGLSATTGAIDFEGDFLMPGMIEIHTDNFERHLMPRPKVMWAEKPALIAHDAEIACAGITTVFDALGVGEADTESVRGQPGALYSQLLINIQKRIYCGQITIFMCAVNYQHPTPLIFLRRSMATRVSASSR